MDAPQSQTFTVKVNPDGGAVTDDTPALPAQQEDFRNNPDYVPDDPVGGEGETDGQESETEPKDPAPQQQPSDADLQQRLDTNATDIQTAAQFIESKGVSYEKVVSEYAQNGRLSDESYDKLQKAGIPRSMIDSYCAGQEALYELWVNHVQGIAGGEKAYGELMRYAAQNLTDREKEAYDAAVNSGDMARAKNAVQSLMYQFQQTHPTDGYTYEGKATNSTSAPVKGFATPEEAYAMQDDPRMYTDPAFQRLFQQRLMKTTFLKD